MSNIIMNAEFMAKAKSIKSFEELKSLVADEGIEVADDELMAKWEKYTSDVETLELPDDELGNVAGGCGSDIPEPKYLIGQYLYRSDTPWKFEITASEWRGNSWYYHLVELIGGGKAVEEGWFSEAELKTSFRKR